MVTALQRRAWLVGLAALAIATSAGATPMLVLEIDGQGQDAFVSRGEAFSLSVRALDIPPGSDLRGLFGFGFAALFDSAAFPGATTPVFDATSFPSQGATRNLPGEVGATANRFLAAGAGPTGSFVVATFDLTAGSARGLFDLDLTGFSHEADGTAIPGDNVLHDGTELDAASLFFSGARVRVPEPGTAWLALAALAAAATATRRDVGGSFGGRTLRDDEFPLSSRNVRHAADPT